MKWEAVPGRREMNEAAKNPVLLDKPPAAKGNYFVFLGITKGDQLFQKQR